MSLYDVVVQRWRASLPSVGMASKGAAASYDAVIGKLMRDFDVPV